ncbi:uncharacterized protein LOC106876296 [Octopus bimaculoides]|uniref:Uncharacterized protein n=1 Tax=Octopus bimaculoides TaxID=37653 RepID=A0A0L8GLC2_OCTBM|nr:uncharacterized protein LOC106876296 [Octopus bimaculoides]|eukprot:XP_014780278.1 PREDICTED: uncharacterized protein LOC106876296 [Octopus bimaculoides]
MQKTNGNASSITRPIQEDKLMNGAEVDRSIITMDQSLDEIRMINNIPKAEILENVRSMSCNGTGNHYTCYQVTGIRTVGIYFTFDIHIGKGYFQLLMTVNGKQQKIKLWNRKMLFLKVKVKRLPILSVCFFAVRFKIHYRQWCVMVTTNINEKTYVRQVGCFHNRDHKPPRR